MTKLKQLTPREVLFIGGETPNVYQHTAGVALLDPSGVPGFGFELFRRHIDERLANIPHFRWRLHEVPLGLDLPYWVEDRQFSLDNHLRRIALPAPGDRQALADVVAYLYSRHLDRSRPLWEAWFIEGLADGRYALLQKLHHCMMDGEGGVRLAEALWDFAPDAPPPELDAHLTAARPGAVPAPWRQSLNVAMHLSQLPLRASRKIYAALRHEVARRATGGVRQGQRPSAPRTAFNRQIGGERGLVFGALPLAAVKAVKNRFGVTVNDVLLALVGSSMRAYLLERDALPARSLRTSIPVSLRTAADDEFSNRVTTTSATLATDLDDPVERLRVIAAESRGAKEQAHQGGVGVLEIVQLLPPVLVNAMIALTPGERMAELAGVNLVVSNIRGSDVPMYVCGARVDAVYPMSIITPGGGINVTCLSYAGQVQVGITIEPALVPDPWHIVDGLGDALAEYTALATKTRGGRKQGAGAGARRERQRAPAQQPKKRAPKQNRQNRRRAPKARPAPRT